MLGLAAVLLAAASIGAPNHGVVPAAAATIARGGINVEPSARPWQYVGANPDSWWCPGASSCTTSNPQAHIDTEMALAAQLHVANVRLEIPWFLVEPGNGVYDWTRADYIFNSATSHGIQIQPILVYTPGWLGAYDSFPTPAAFKSFVAAFMARYGGRISAVEMWNEPDGGQSLLQNDPVQYVNDILIPGYQAVKASAYPGVSVIEGGSINDSGACCAWLSGIYNAGGGSYFNIAAFHDYGGNYAAITQAYQGVINAHSANGAKPIWLGEYGVSDSSGSNQTSLIQGALTGTPGLAMAQFYTLRDESVYTCCPPASTGEHKAYGVVASDDVTRKSSFNTMQSLLGGSSPPPSPSPLPSPKPTPSSAKPSPSPSASPKASPSGSAGHSPSTSKTTPGATPRASGSPLSSFLGGGSFFGGGGVAGSNMRAHILQGGLLMIGVAILGSGIWLVLDLNAFSARGARPTGGGTRPPGAGRPRRTTSWRSRLGQRPLLGTLVAMCGVLMSISAGMLLAR